MSYIHTDGVEYSDDKKTLVRCPKEAKGFTIIDGVESIGKSAFSGCSGLTSLVIPESVKKRAFVAAKSAFWGIDDDNYSKYGGYNGYDDDTIDSAFEGDPELTWNVD